MYSKNIWLEANEEKVNKIMEFNEGYKKYISLGKTERVCVELSVEIAEQHGYKNLKQATSIKPGDKFYLVNLNKNSVDKNNLEFVSLSYEELGIKNFDLSSNKKSNTINFRNEVSIFVESIYDELKMKLLPIIIIVIMFIAVGSYFFSVIFITLLFKLLYRYLQIDFGTVFKAVILSSTPYVICSLLAIVLGINLLEIIGQFIMIAYATKALTTYKIKYDGGMPLPGYMRNMMNDKKDDEEKGSGDDEL